MTKLIGEATWYVREEEIDDYLNAGAAHVVRGGTLVQNRNAALRDSRVAGLPCIQLDDDLKRIRNAAGQDISFFFAASLMLNRLRSSAYRLAGVAPTDNAYFSRREITNFGFIIASFMVELPDSMLWFDPDLKLKEDYDHTVAHLKTYGGVVRCDDILATFNHYTAPGGCKAYRTEEIEKESCAVLLQRHRGWLRPHGKRPHELSLVRPGRA